MARPAALQFLKKGMLLAGKVFPQFVATWNWLVRAFDSLMGDKDINPNQGYITVDRTNQDRPIIRFDMASLIRKLKDNESTTPGCFEIVWPAVIPSSEEGGSPTTTPGGFLNPYYVVGGKLYAANNITSTSGFNYSDCFIALNVDISSTTPSASIVTFATFTAMANAVCTDTMIYPLYQIDETGALAADLRNIPSESAWEV